MKIDATTYQKLPEHLKALFQQAPNPSREEVLAAFPQEITKSTGGKNSKGGMGNRVFGSYALDRTAQNTGGLGDEGTPARFFYCAKASKADRNAGLGEGETNTHVTVKPVSLMSYLCRLITPPNGIVLDPFNGSGSTGKGAMLENFRYLGIDLSDEYVKISEARIKYAHENREKLKADIMKQQKKVDPEPKAKEPKQSSNSLTNLFQKP